MTITNTQQVFWLKEITSGIAGGKAHGLSQLMQWGLNVPNGFAIVNALQGEYPDDLAERYLALGEGKVAVRSSALGEDGVASSFAGQYETILNVEGIDALKIAIDDCVASLNNQRANAYAAEQNIHSTQMNIVVQCMVDAASAGVAFTVDPVSGRYDRFVIDAVDGFGEALVSGELTPDHYEYDQNAELQCAELVGEKAILSKTQCQEMIKQANQAVQLAGMPLDLEWAIDKLGQLFWLQARPITTIGSDLAELDTPLNEGDILTRCNVGEMMPGACCPLTFSTTGRAIEHGMQHMHVTYAGRPAITEEWTQLAMFHGKLFLNLSGAAAAASTVLGVDVKSLGHSVCGRVIENLHEPKKRSVWIRLGGMIKLLNYLKQADTVIEAFERKLAVFELPKTGTSVELAQALDKAQDFLYEVSCVHLQSSTTSGFASNILQAIISGGQESNPEEEAEAAKLMAGASGVESAVLVEQLDDVVNRIALAAETDASIQTAFITATPVAANDWLQSNLTGDIQIAFKQFLARHGHRSYRELCMREVSWADAPEALIETMQASVKARLAGVKASAKPLPVDTASLSRGLRWILPKAHNAVRRRESTKSMLVDVTNRLKQCYRLLGQQLVTEGLLTDADQVFFFTHQELMSFTSIHGETKPSPELWQQKASQRRIALEFQDRLDFDEISEGRPIPIDKRLDESSDGSNIIGRPVSRGIIEAVARVALNVSEASALKPGEILVAPITDVGWTPYFSMISGLVTDVGSAVSHGAVIAREYGLPAIVNTRVGTQRIKTGDTIRLDANTGEITIL